MNRPSSVHLSLMLLVILSASVDALHFASAGSCRRAAGESTDPDIQRLGQVVIKTDVHFNKHSDFRINLTVVHNGLQAAAGNENSVTGLTIILPFNEYNTTGPNKKPLRKSCMMAPLDTVHSFEDCLNRVLQGRVRECSVELMKGAYGQHVDNVAMEAFVGKNLTCNCEVEGCWKFSTCQRPSTADKCLMCAVPEFEFAWQRKPALNYRKVDTYRRDGGMRIVINLKVRGWFGQMIRSRSKDKSKRRNLGFMHAHHHLSANLSILSTGWDSSQIVHCNVTSNMTNLRNRNRMSTTVHVECDVSGIGSFLIYAKVYNHYGVTRGVMVFENGRLILTNIEMTT